MGGYSGRENQRILFEMVSQHMHRRSERAHVLQGYKFREPGETYKVVRKTRLTKPTLE